MILAQPTPSFCYRSIKVLIAVVGIGILLGHDNPLNAQAPDLSKMSEAQREQGFGQFQPSKPEPSHDSSSQQKKKEETTASRRTT
jgi:hypothetical protein